MFANDFCKNKNIVENNNKKKKIFICDIYIFRSFVDYIQNIIDNKNKFEKILIGNNCKIKNIIDFVQNNDKIEKTFVSDIYKF